MKLCQVCQKDKCKEFINFGFHPVCHKFENNEKKYEKFSLSLGKCDYCGLVQLMSPISYEKLTPIYNWISYNEPEEHLDHLTNVISKLPGINNNSTVCGVSYKEDSTLLRFNKLGFKNTWSINMRKDLGIDNLNANLETIQKHIQPNIVNKIINHRKRPDVIIVRHILEHAHDTRSFMLTLKKIVKPSGYIVFEVPDCLNGLTKPDYTTIWEEHILYFTETSFKNCMKAVGFSMQYFEKYNYPSENILIGIVRSNGQNLSEIVFKNSSSDFGESQISLNPQKLSKDRISLKKFLAKYKKKNYDIAIFGTGHAACMYINILEIEDLIDFAVDDDKNKIGLNIPGSKISISSSKNIFNSNALLCLLALNSESEEKVLKKIKTVKNKKKIFFSIYPSSKYSIQI